MRHLAHRILYLFRTFSSVLVAYYLHIIISKNFYPRKAVIALLFFIFFWGGSFPLVMNESIQLWNWTWKRLEQDDEMTSIIDLHTKRLTDATQR